MHAAAEYQLRTGAFTDMRVINETQNWIQRRETRPSEISLNNL